MICFMTCKPKTTTNQYQRLVTDLGQANGYRPLSKFRCLRLSFAAPSLLPLSVEEFEPSQLLYQVIGIFKKQKNQTTGEGDGVSPQVAPLLNSSFTSSLYNFY